MKTNIPKTAIQRTETKHDRFLRVRKQKLRLAKEAMRRISNLGTRPYEHTREEGTDIIRELFDELMVTAWRLGVVSSGRVERGPVISTRR